MLSARFNLITLDPASLGDYVKYIRTDIRPGIERQRGSLGTSLYANGGLGTAVFESFWTTGEMLRASEQTVPPTRREVLRRAAGTLTVERYRVPVFELEDAPRAGAGLRLTRMDLYPGKVEDAVQVYGDTAVPWLADTEGFCSGLLLVDWDTGHALSETVWRDAQALAASRSTAAEVRAETVASTGWEIRAVEEYSLVSSSARKA